MMSSNAEYFALKGTLHLQSKGKNDPFTSSISGTNDTVDGGLQDRRISTFAAMVVLRIHFNLNLCGGFLHLRVLLMYKMILCQPLMV